MTMRLPKLNKMLKDFVKDKVTKHVPSGVCSRFVRLDEFWGVKCYQGKRKRDKAIKDQKKARRHRLAPRCGLTFKIRTEGLVDFKNYGETRDVYCFVTQIATQVGRATYKEEDKLSKLLSDAGLREAATDLHRHNIGLVDDKLVCIDFVF
jgi:hypothetical protein